MPRITGLILAALAAALAGQTSHAQSDDKLTKKVEKLDAQLVKKCSELALKYDEAKDPEAAHFFASCAIGFGCKDDKVIGIKNAWEIAVFIGKVRGGQLLKDVEPIISALSGLNQEYRGIRDTLWTPGIRGTLPESSIKLLREAGVKMELTQSAHEYIRITQRFNSLRQAMGLRAIYWDFENSTRLILVGWYMGQTGDYTDDQFSKGGANKTHPLYTQAVEDAKRDTARSHTIELSQYPDYLKGFPQLRQDILNPNARMLWFAHWSKGATLPRMVLYAIPQLPYRDDIPTPTARFKDETLVKPWSEWIDTEDTITLGGMKVPYVRYPYDGESDAPFTCYAGEEGWEKEEYKHLRNAGVPIMLRFFMKTIPTEVESSLVDGKSKTISCRLYLNGDKRVHRLGGWATVLLLPEEQLRQGEKYAVTIKCKVENAPFERAWTFTTRKE